MPRAGWVKPVSDRRLSDLVSVGELTRVFPPALVDEVIAEAGPEARIVALAGCATHAMFDVEVGGCSTSEMALAEPLLDRLEPGMVLLADRGFYSYAMWRRAAAAGADLLWRAKTGLRPTYLETLQDGSWLAQIRPSNDK